MDENKIRKLTNENDEDYIYRICEMKEQIGTWKDVANILNNELDADRDESRYRKRYATHIREMSLLENSAALDEEYIEKIRIERRELEKERKKYQTEKIEYNKWIREEARDELIAEKICDAISELRPLDVPDCKVTWNDDKQGILCFGDEHYAAEFIIYGLHGEIINQYNPEIFEQRMWNLLSQVKEIINKENLDMIHVFSLGDFTDGLLRCGQLAKLRYGVIEGTVRYADFISTWLNELSKFIRIKYQMTYGNHSELRLLGQPKGTFKDENTGLFVREMIKTRLANNKNFEMTINPTGLIFDNIEGFNILGIHGECRNMEKALKDFSNTYNTNIDILIGGHMHHYKSETVGVDKDVINVPSIIGIDDFSMSLNKTSRPGATFLTITKDNGISTEYKIKL